MKTLLVALLYHRRIRGMFKPSRVLARRQSSLCKLAARSFIGLGGVVKGIEIFLVLTGFVVLPENHPRIGIRMHEFTFSHS
jgi:hypothetical protein